MRKHFLSILAIGAFIGAAPTAAQTDGAQDDAPPVADNEVVDNETAGNEIVVTAEMEREAEERLEQITRSITRRTRVDKPLAKQYEPICIGIIGMNADYAGVLIARIEEHARRLDIPLAGEDCQPNTIVAFAKDARAQIEQLRKDSEWLFTGLLDHEYKRILRGNGGAHAWQTTETREVDGKQLNTIQFGNPPRQVQTADPFNATRMAQQIRTDMTASVVVFDGEAIAGKTLQQLADYASIRSFANVDDLSGGAPNATDSILALFDEEFEPPQGLTEFDWAYLDALYKLPRTARGNAIHDAAWSAYRKNVWDKDD